MRYKTPHFGPFAGRLCRVLEDGRLEPVPEPNCSVLQPTLPELGRPGRETIEPGEIAGYDTRGSREQLRRQIVESGGSEAWANEKAANAVANWDRGIRAGSIARGRG